MPQPSDTPLDRRMALMLAGGMAFAAAPAAAAPDPALKAELMAVLGEFSRRSSARDLGAADLFDTDNALMIGSDAGEVCLGHDAIRAHLTQYFSLPARFSFDWQTTHGGRTGGSGAWLWSEGYVVQTWKDGRTERAPYRVACVFVRRGKAWRIRLFSGSEPAKG